MVTVDGVPVAELGPLGAVPEVRLADLVAAGLVDPPGRRGRPPAPEVEDAPVDVRPDGALDELRGR